MAGGNSAAYRPGRILAKASRRAFPGVGIHHAAVAQGVIGGHIDPPAMVSWLELVAAGRFCSSGMLRNLGVFITAGTAHTGCNQMPGLIRPAYEKLTIVSLDPLLG